MNEILILAIGAGFTALGALLSGLVLHALRGQREADTVQAAEIKSLDAKINETREAVARLEGNRGILGTHQNWRE